MAINTTQIDTLHTEIEGESLYICPGQSTLLNLTWQDSGVDAHLIAVLIALSP